MQSNPKDQSVGADSIPSAEGFSHPIPQLPPKPPVAMKPSKMKEKRAWALR